MFLDREGSDGLFAYVGGMLMKPGAAVPEGYYSRELAATKVAVGWVQGVDHGEVFAKAHALTGKALQEAGLDNVGITWMLELYNCPCFTMPDENGNITLDY